MKAKEAIKLIESHVGEGGPWPLLVKLYKSEADGRILLRSAGRRPSQCVVSGIADEMGQWIEIVARGVKLEEEYVKLLVDGQRGDLFVKYRVMDPIAEKSMKDMRSAVLRGEHPLDVATTGGLDAITAMMLGQMTRDVTRELHEHFKDKGPPCPHGVEARFCKDQETYSKGFPTGNVEDLAFICTKDPKKCDWKKPKE